MKHKVIIADDSTTIHKVAKIILAKEDYELILCSSSDELMGLIQENNPSIVLLDFNLSESKTGYDLSREVKSISNSKVILLYGTFDTIDESLFLDAGVNDYLVKPFDDNKLKNKCRQQINDYEMDHEASSDGVEGEEFEAEEIDGEEFEAEELVVGDIEGEEIEAEEFEAEEIEASTDDKIDAVEIGDEWVVNQPDHIEEEDEAEDPLGKTDIIDTSHEVTKEEINHLEAGMQEWGIDVPGVIGVESNSVKLPPIIGQEGAILTETSINTSDVIVDKDDSQDDSIESQFSAEPTIEFNLKESGFVPESEEEQKEPEVIPTDSDGSSIVPDDDDLEYPDVDKIKEDIANEDVQQPQFTPMTDLVSEVEVSKEKPEEGIELTQTLGTNTEKEVEALKEQIADEVEESSEELWTTDEIVDEEVLNKPHQEETKQSSSSSQEIKFGETYESPYKQDLYVENQKHAASVESIQISDEEIRSKIDELLAPMVERLVQEKIDKIIEKISWEVIPDLAENIIRKELEKVSEEVLSQNN